MLKYDVVVVGAGPAGSTAARYCALKGVNTLLIDKKKDIGIPVQCGEFLPTLGELKNVLTKVPNLDELLDIETRFISRKTNAVQFVTPKMRQYTLEMKGITIERRMYDRHLAVKAVEAGADIKINTKVIGFNGKKIKTNKGSIEAKVIIGADGPHSQIARVAGLSQPKILSPCIGEEIAGDFGSVVKMYFGNVAPGGYAWIIPKKETANIGLGIQKGVVNSTLRKLLDKFKTRVCTSQAKPIFTTTGLVPISGPIPKTVKNNILIVGDAAGHVMATNGGGIPIAMVCGRIAGNVVGDHITLGASLEKYETAWRNAVGTELKNSVQTKKMADMFFGHDKMLEFIMKIMGIKTMERAVKCKSLFTP